VGGVIDLIDLIAFQGSGPYIVRNCPLLTPQLDAGDFTSSILVTGSDDSVSETVDILIQDTSATGSKLNGQLGAIFRPNTGKLVCASIIQSVFTDLVVGVTALRQTFLDLSDVTLTSNSVGFRAVGSEVDVKDSFFCSNQNDVRLEDGATGTFSNTTCSSTNPTSILNETCAMLCPS
jgi:hypothetical protein